MKQKRKTFTPIIISVLVLSLMSSCVVNKPDLNGISHKDYNTRRKVSGAHYTKRLSVPGIILTAAAPVAGAVAGYNINMISVQKGEETIPVKPANAAIGAVVGYSVANFINYCVGLNKETPAVDPTKWTKDISDKYVFIPDSRDKDGSFTIIEKAVERDFTVRNFDDIEQFYSVFPSSPYKSQVFQQSIKVCNRSQLLDLLALDKNNQYANDAKKKYIDESRTYEDLASAQNKFSEINYNYEERFASLVKNTSNAIDFHRRYPNSALTKTVIWNAFISSVPSKSEMNSMKSSFGRTFELTELDLSVNPTNTQKCNFIRASYQASNIKDETDLELFYRKYSWLAYNEKATDIVSNVYSIAYNSFDNGNYIIYYLKQLPQDPLYKSWGVTSSIVQTAIDAQMKVEAEKVNIASTYSIGQNNSDWDKWVSNMTYTAGIVAGTEDLKYIIYGEIENRSKFDMPVVISASADLVVEASMKTGGGFLGQLFSALFDVAAQQSGVKEKTMSSSSNQFIIPSLPAKTKSSYAILLDFNYNGNVGLNVADWFKVVTESKMKNLKVMRNVEKKSVSYSVLSEQEKWLDMAKNGLPGVTLTDLKRNERVDEEVWAQRWEVERQRRAEAAARAAERYEAESVRNQSNENGRDEAVTQTNSNNNSKDGTIKDVVFLEYMNELEKKNPIYEVQFYEDAVRWIHYRSAYVAYLGDGWYYRRDNWSGFGGAYAFIQSGKYKTKEEAISALQKELYGK